MSVENQKLPSEYGYVGDENLNITAEEFGRQKGMIEYFLTQETKFYYPEKYKYINKVTGETIKTVTEKNKDVAVKVVDIESTLNSTPIIFRTQEGINLLRMKYSMEKIHVSAIDSGIAKHKSYFEKLEENEVEK